MTVVHKYSVGVSIWISNELIMLIYILHCVFLEYGEQGRVVVASIANTAAKDRALFCKVYVELDNANHAAA